MPGEETILARRQRLSLLPRACEACKVRKIRCDRSHPCGNCRASGIACQQANPPPDNRPKTDRVTQLEEYVATLEARLAKVELRLGNADLGSTPLKEAPSVPPATGTPSEPKLYEISPSGASGLYEGSTSFLNESTLASEVAQRTATSTSGTPEAAQTISESFNHLESLLRSGAESQDQQSSTGTSSRPVPAITPLPVSLVITLLRRIKTRPSMFLSGYAITDLPLVEHLCQRVYFPTEPVSIGHVTSVNGILHLLLREYEILKKPLGEGWDAKQLSAQASRNFDIGIESFEMMTVPSFENVLALTLGVIKAQTETINPVLFRALVASACSHCQMLGYHRESTFQKDRSGFAENKRRLFWMLCSYDRADSLLFGHASKVQDFDIDTRLPTPSSSPFQRPWDDLFRLGISMTGIQGQIYNKLYSVAALQSPPGERKRWIDKLTAELCEWKNDFDQWDYSGVELVSPAELSRIHWTINYYSTMTSLLRVPATPGEGIDMTSQCFQAARLALHNHLRCFSGYGGENWVSKSEYINWALHNSSFTPFIVIFLHSIAASSLEDVQLLDQVVETLASARNRQAGTERQYRICVTFARLARRMIEARNTSVGMYDQMTDSLQVSGVSEDAPLSWPEACLTQPQAQQIEPGGFSDFLDEDMSLILANWINGQPPATDMFNMDLIE